MIPDRIRQKIEQINCVILVTHMNPDGDALGSMFGFAEMLRSLGKNVLCYLEEPVSHIWKFLPGCQRAVIDIDAVKQFAASADGDLAIVSLDCGSAERLGRHKDELLAVKPFLVIDHHRGHERYGTDLWLESARSSTGEMIYKLGQELGATISAECAENLYVAICTDTGSFRYDSTTSTTMRIAADLLDRGVNPAKTASNIYDNYSLARLRLMEQVLSTLELHRSGQLAFIHVTREMMDNTGASDGDTEGFINYPRSLRSVKVAVFLKEMKDGVIAVSMRAKGECDVAAIAAWFGGGGHRNAAGCRFFDSTLEQVREQMLTKLGNALG